MKRTNPHIEKASHCAYCIRFHIVIATKYRHKILIDRVAKAAQIGLEVGCDRAGVKLEKFAIQPDHLHILVSAQPTTYIPDLIASIKRHIAINIARSSTRTDGQILSRSYYIASVGGYDKSSQIEEYIAAQA